MSSWIRADDGGEWHRYRHADNTDAWDDGITCVCGRYITASRGWTEPTGEMPDRELHTVCSSVAAREAHWQGMFEGVQQQAMPSRISNLSLELVPGLGAVVVTLYPSSTSGLPWQHVALRAENLMSDVAGSGESFAEAAGELLAALESQPPLRLVPTVNDDGHVTLGDAD